MNPHFSNSISSDDLISSVASVSKVIGDQDRIPSHQHSIAAQSFLLSDAVASGIAKDFDFVKKIPQFIKQIIDNKLWECFYIAKGVVTPYYCRYTKGTNEENFIAFIQADRPNGLGTSVEEIDKLLDLDIEVKKIFREAVGHTESDIESIIVSYKIQLEDKIKKITSELNSAKTEQNEYSQILKLLCKKEYPEIIDLIDFNKKQIYPENQVYRKTKYSSVILSVIEQLIIKHQNEIKQRKIAEVYRILCEICTQKKLKIPSYSMFYSETKRILNILQSLNGQQTQYK